MTTKHFFTNTVGIAMLVGSLMLAPQVSKAQVFLSVGFAPPAIPIYEQPYCPGEGYIWTPGYWAYTDDGYEWVDGAWVLAPYTGALWTPGYWGYAGSGYFWNAGYWGPSVGYYGGINYGFGYFGTGFYGGYWNDGSFFYNREYSHFDRDRDFHHVYDRHVDGFDGRPGGASYARGLSNDSRGGTFNRAGGFNGETNRNGFGQDGNTKLRSTNQPFRGTYNGSPATNNFTGNRGGASQARPLNNFNPGYGGTTSPRPSSPGSSFRPSQGASEARGFSSGYGGNNSLRTTSPVNGFHPSQGASEARGFGGGSNARPSAPVNGFHPSQGGNFGGGMPHSAPSPSFQGGGGQHSAPAPSFQGGGSFHGGGGAGGGSGFHGGGHR